MSDRKRPFEDVDSDVTSNKKLKSDTTQGSNVPAAGRTAPDPEYFAKKRAEITAKAAAMLKTNPTVKRQTTVAAPIPRVPVLPVSDPSKVVYAVTPSPSISAGPTPATPTTPASGTGTPAAGSEDINRRIAEARRRVADAKTKLAVKDNPYMSVAMTNKKKGGTPAVEQTQQGAGLKMTAHPLLLDQTPAVPQSKKDRYKPMQPKFASIKANVRSQPSPVPVPISSLTPAPSANPYSAASSSAAKEGTTGFEGAPRERAGKKFHFNPKGKYVAMANQMRQDQQLEALRLRIAESARKAGMDGDLGIEKAIKRAPPPEVEWWDESLLPSKRYTDIDTFGMERLNIRTQNSPINSLILHPIPIPAPAEKSGIELKAMKLTTREQKKMRKLKRKQELQDKRDRIRMGLLPPDAPKVRLANLMKVLTSDAIQDPTRVEARVRREVAMRKHTHEKMNAERKLTDDQRREKKENKKLEEEKRGVHGAVYKILTLSDPSHQFKVRKNAEQRNLTGLCIFNPTFNLVYVEGASKFMKTYKRLMLHRISWTEAARSRGGADEVELENPASDVEDDGQTDARRPSTTATATTTTAKGLDGEDPKSLENNKCFLIWEGALRDREFSGFRAKSCPTDRDAKETLGEKLKGYWDVAKNWKAEDVDEALYSF